MNRLYIEPGLRRAVSPRNSVHYLLFVVTLAAIATFISYVLLPMLIPNIARAEQTGPMTNQEACKEMKDLHASLKENPGSVVNAKCL